MWIWIAILETQSTAQTDTKRNRPKISDSVQHSDSFFFIGKQLFIPELDNERLDLGLYKIKLGQARLDNPLYILLGASDVSVHPVINVFFFGVVRYEDQKKTRGLKNPLIS